MRSSPWVRTALDAIAAPDTPAGDGERSGAASRGPFRVPRVGWIYTELVLVSLAAMLSPTTLTFSVLALVLSPRPFRSGCWFLLGAFTATIAVGIAAAFVSATSPLVDALEPKTWVAILDVVFAGGADRLARCASSAGRPIRRRRRRRSTG